VAAAAYRASAIITNDYDGITHDYTRKRGVVHTEVMLPKNAPAIYAARCALWNAVEAIEKAKNSQLAREIEVALPVELSREQSIALVRKYVKRNFVDAGMCADFCIHDKKDGNPHAHIMLTIRPFETDGAWSNRQKKIYILDEQGNKIYDKKKRTYQCAKVQTTDWHEQNKAEEWRSSWADCVNVALEKANHPERIDHRSYERQGTEQIPTVHMGSAAWRMELRGIATERGNRNRKILSMNQELRRLRARIGKLQKWIDAETRSEERGANLSSILSSDNLLALLTNMLESGEGKSRRRKVIDLQAASRAWAFLQDNRITTLAELGAKVTSMRGDLSNIREKVKPVERRLGTLNEHFTQVEIYRTHSALYKVYMKTKPKQQAAFYEQHRAEIVLYESAQKYLDAHLNGRKNIPLAQWKAEAKELAIELKHLHLELDRQKDEVRKVEIIQRGMTQLVRESTREAQRASTNREADFH
jgi:MobA/MobL family.